MRTNTVCQSGTPLSIALQFDKPQRLFFLLLGQLVLFVNLSSSIVFAQDDVQTQIQDNAPIVTICSAGAGSLKSQGNGFIADPKMGGVAVGCPKIWTSDRIFSVLDGIVRDIDSMTIKALEGLDPNQANQALVDILQTSVDIQAKYDQSVQLNNRAALDKFNTVHPAQLADYKNYEAYKQTLLTQQLAINQKLTETRVKEAELIAAGANPTPTSTDPTKLSPEDNELKKTKDLEAAYVNQLKDINTQLAQSAPTIDTLQTGTVSGVEPPSSKTSTMPTLPPGLVSALTDQLKAPSFPPTVQMDNVIDLLHERIAREFAAMYDDLLRNTELYDIYLAQFDVSLLPSRNSKDRNIRLTLDFSSSLGCSVRSYDLYPNAAAYNIFRGFQKTTHLGITGMAQTIFGFGLAATYQRDHTR